MGNRYFPSPLAEAGHTPLQLYARAWKRHGDLVRFESPVSRWYLAVHPDAARHVLIRRAGNYVKPAVLLRPLRQALGEGIFTTDGADWVPWRRWGQLGFGPESREAWKVAAVTAAQELLTGWDNRRPGSAVDVLEEMNALALKTACYSLFGVGCRWDSAALLEAMRELLGHVAHRLARPVGLPLWVPTARHRRFREARRVLEAGVGELLRGSKASGTLSAWTASPAGSEERLRNLAQTILIAATQSMGAALSWAWLLLARHPLVESNLAQGARPARPPYGVNTPLPSYARMVFQETLRLYPTGWVKPRQALEDDVLLGYAVPRGTVVVLSQYLTHRHPDFWPDPEAFVPERFAPEGHPDESPRAYLPFGLGGHYCLGGMMALVQGPLLVEAMARRYRLEPLLDTMPEPGGLSFFLAPEGPVQATLHPRDGSV